MPPPRFVPEDWATIMRPALHTWASGAAITFGITSGRTIWKHQARAPSPPKPYVAIGALAPPTPVGQSWEDGPRAVRVLTAIDLTLYRLTIDGVNYDFTSGVGTTIPLIVAGLIVALAGAGATSPHFSNVVLLSDTLILGNAVMTVSAQLELVLVQYQVGETTFTLSVDVYADPVDGEPESIALSVITGMMRSLENAPVVEAFQTAGLAVRGIAGARRFPTARDGGWEDRAGFDVRFGALGRTAVLITWIEEAALSESFAV